jgi:thiamine biosynthesis lipoprotein
MRVSTELFDILRSARDYFELTGGLFDPTVGSTLVALGYDRSFAPGALDRPSAQPPLPYTFADVVLDEATRTVEKSTHVRLDLGGIVKGRTVDAAGKLLPTPAAIDAGGDAVLLGSGVSGTGWIVEVEDPRDFHRNLLTLRVDNLAVATSGANRRRWMVGGTIAHHLIDPRTRMPAASDLTQVTVVAGTVELAEILAKTTFILGSDDGDSFLRQFAGIAAILVGIGGDLWTVGDLEVLHA